MTLTRDIGRKYAKPSNPEIFLKEKAKANAVITSIVTVAGQKNIVQNKVRAPRD